jgi:acyl-CoA reductase-like NAD-dependent aldehyde dehydrogenase
MTTTEHRQFIGGEWTGASGEGIFEDLDPYSGEVVATVAAGTREDARQAIEAAFPAWSPSPPAERQRVLLAAADILERRAEEVVGLLARETGCVTYGFGMDTVAGRVAIDEFTELRWVTVQSGTRPFPF